MNKHNFTLQNYIPAMIIYACLCPGHIFVNITFLFLFPPFLSPSSPSSFLSFFPWLSEAKFPETGKTGQGVSCFFLMVLGSHCLTPYLKQGKSHLWKLNVGVSQIRRYIWDHFSEVCGKCWGPRHHNHWWSSLLCYLKCFQEVPGPGGGWHHPRLSLAMGLSRERQRHPTEGKCRGHTEDQPWVCDLGNWGWGPWDLSFQTPSLLGHCSVRLCMLWTTDYDSMEHPRDEQCTILATLWGSSGNAHEWAGQDLHTDSIWMNIHFHKAKLRALWFTLYFPMFNRDMATENYVSIIRRAVV